MEEEIPTRQVMVEDKRIALYQIGQGFPIILLHGLLARGAWSLKHLAQKLANHFLVLGIHQPGYEGSEELRYNSLGELAKFLVPELLKTLGIKERVHLFGASTGGTLALVTASEFPGRVAKIALFEPVFSKKNAWLPWRIAAFFASFPGFVWTLRQSLTRTPLTDFRGARAGSTIGALIRLAKLISISDLSQNCQKVSQLEIPTLLAFGQKSSLLLSLSSMKEIAKLMPGSHQIELREADHTLKREFQEILANHLIKFFLS